MKGIILAGGSGTRLYPITKGVSKQLLPIYDKPMIYYPLSVLMLAGIQNIQIITTKEDLHNFQRLLNDGTELGVHISYAIQEAPEGIAQAFIISESFIGDDEVCLILGDNIFYGDKLTQTLQQVISLKDHARIFCTHVTNPEQFGVIELSENMQPLGITEKPHQPKSNYIVTGLYCYPNNVVEIAKTITQSKRGELEITDINNIYLEQGKLHLEFLGYGYVWLDMGTPDSMLEASHFVKTIEYQKGVKIACLEEIALNHGWITKAKLQKLPQPTKSAYNNYLSRLAENPIRLTTINNSNNIARALETTKDGNTKKYLSKIALHTKKPQTSTKNPHPT